MIRTYTVYPSSGQVLAVLSLALNDPQIIVATLDAQTPGTASGMWIVEGEDVFISNPSYSSDYGGAKELRAFHIISWYAVSHGEIIS